MTRQTRQPEDEFRISLSKLARKQPGNLVKVLLHFSYGTSFDSFLSILKDETALQKENGGFTLEDGPWRYNIILNGKIRGFWCSLKDERSFDDLLHKLRASEGEAVMIHVSTFLQIHS